MYGINCILKFSSKQSFIISITTGVPLFAYIVDCVHISILQVSLVMLYLVVFDSETNCWSARNCITLTFRFVTHRSTSNDILKYILNLFLSTSSLLAHKFRIILCHWAHPYATLLNLHRYPHRMVLLWNLDKILTFYSGPISKLSMPNLYWHAISLAFFHFKIVLYWFSPLYCKYLFIFYYQGWLVWIFSIQC